MSGEIYELFEALQPDDRKDFMAFVKAAYQAQGFSLRDLVASKEDGGIKCPEGCNTDSKGIVKFGIRRAIQYYRCKPCGKTFSGVTNTLWSYTKKDFHVWKRYINCMRDGYSLRKAAAACKIHRNTAFMWRHKILDALAQYQNSREPMTGIIEADDTYFRLSFKGSKWRTRKAPKPGLSKDNLACVSCAVDRNGQRYSKISACGKPKAEALRKVYRNRLSKHAVVCTDKCTSYRKYGKNRSFTHIRLAGAMARRGRYHSQNVNAYHSRLKRFMKKFLGVATKYLNNYLVWFNLIIEGARTRIALLKLCIKAVTSSRWYDIGDRSAIPT